MFKVALSVSFRELDKIYEIDHERDGLIIAKNSSSLTMHKGNNYLARHHRHQIIRSWQSVITILVILRARGLLFLGHEVRSCLYPIHQKV